uniref:Uncharacterized protein n=1 Tax=Anguilla anguilla TaxID=7936 RepID=A0A0E9UBB7_ANGAN
MTEKAYWKFTVAKTPLWVTLIFNNTLVAFCSETKWKEPVTPLLRMSQIT